MRILVFCDNYPKPGRGYNDAFVRTRLEAYREELGAEIQVVKLNKHACRDQPYELNGIRVISIGRAELATVVREFAPDVVLAHFIQAHLCDQLPLLTQAPLIVWVHGEEALSWTNRLFYLKTLSLPQFLRYVVRNHIQRAAMKRLFRRANAGGAIDFVFVSRWMREIAESDVGQRLERALEIPNYINTDQFHFSEKSEADRRRILLIRSFDSAKYANDLAIDAIHQLAKTYPGFAQLQFTIVGQGSLWDELTRGLEFPNVERINQMLDHDGIKAMHDRHGVFLCPTRQDAQGVSMCEAMGSGLVPIASDNTAIPEFVSTEEGYLTHGADEIAAAIRELDEQPALFLDKSRKAGARTLAQTGWQATILREVELIRERTSLLPVQAS
ncbi:glycosyltransferase involved in cell wall biosynthesis [Pelomonas aquatica]|uniref:Glycosyltransferase involved in cell wall biosynthesis n=2 Tax=Pelomonas aquatica TaxID=431058 RepID=A0ABU1Z5B8_9BURK|nr:glycosyltransferase involved in cell wall biosynthesis [Pelomonas aquatica]